MNGAVTLADERMPDIAWRAQALFSELALAKGDSGTALQAALRAVTYLGQTRRSLSDESLVHTFLNSSPTVASDRAHLYDQAIRLALQNNHLESVLQVIEERRAQLLAERLRRPAGKHTTVRLDLQSCSTAGRVSRLRWPACAKH